MKAIGFKSPPMTGLQLACTMPTLVLWRTDAHIHLQHSGSLPVDPWRDVVIKLLDPEGPYPYRSSSTDPLQSRAVIALLEKEIEEATKRPDCNAIFRQFKQPVDKFVCGSNIHCETALVALA